jgi:hypothetical protein
MGRGLHEIAGREKGRRKDRKRNLEEADGVVVNKEAWERVEAFRIGERVGSSPARNKYRRKEPWRKGKRKSKWGAEEGDNKNMRWTRSRRV